jgi:hypothetical protein
VDRFSVFVDTENADIQIIARILEIVGITAKKSDLLFGSENEPNIGVPLIAIELITAALIKRDDIAAQSCLA